jgi:hypothetical protein
MPSRASISAKVSAARQGRLMNSETKNAALRERSFFAGCISDHLPSEGDYRIGFSSSN